MKRLRRILDDIYATAALLAAFCLAAIAVLVLAQITGRWFGVLLPATEDFAGFLMAAATFLALASTLRSGGHIRVTLLIRQLAPRARRRQEVAVLGIGLALAIALAWSCTSLVIESFEYGDTASGLVAVPLWIPQLPMALGLIVFAIALADAFVGTLANGPEQNP